MVPVSDRPDRDFSLSTIRIAIHAGITQTGSHPISRIRIDCSMKLAPTKNTIATIMGQPIKSSGDSGRPGL